MDRKQFLRVMGALAGTLGATALLDACQRWLGESASLSTPTAPILASDQFPATSSAANTPMPTLTLPTPTPTPDPSLATVSLVKTTDRLSGVQQAVDLLGDVQVRGKQVLIKPNFNSADTPPGSTHNDTLWALLQVLLDLGAAGLTIADRSGMGVTRQVMQSKGIFALAKEFGAQVVVLDELPEEEWVLVRRDDLHWSAGFPVPKLFLEAESIVQTCNLKTHRYGGHFTLSLKNSVGIVGNYYGGRSYMNELHNSPNQRKMIAETNLVYTPELVLMDGVAAFTDGGPDYGTLVYPELMLAGRDRVALDAIGVAILRYFGTTLEVRSGQVFEQEQLARAVELGLGVSSVDKIRVLTGDAEAQVFWDEVKGLM